MTFGSYFSFISKVAIIAIITGIQIAMLRIGSLPFRYHSSPGVICKSLNKEPYPRIVRILPLIDIVSEMQRVSVRREIKKIKKDSEAELKLQSIAKGFVL